MTMARQLRTQDLSAGYDARVILKDISLEVPAGRITAIVGGNASGKSTLLRTLARILKPKGGSVLLDGNVIHDMPSNAVARIMGLLPQSPIAPEGITVVDLVGRGRHPHHGLFSRWNAADDRAVTDALTATGIAGLAERDLETLSGGQRQRAWIAMALAQQTDLLLLDEPTTFLDVAHQIDVLDLLVDMNLSRGTTVVMVLHDLNLAVRYADHLIAVAQGGIHCQGTPADVLTEATVKTVFGLDCRIVTDPVSGTPTMVPIGRHKSGSVGQEAQSRK
ncbi:ABC transporter ATP-binding protein [Sulfitobacter pseudonitzschiae]|uniref:ABC transporter ATP-binding protein n=1 Tax=Pseudosulfitobacter pseudonitzschiae TaxID=1402135 RepID=A0A9Q2P4N1_9RHOB|nr:ABC transporter ATP-binding protein [Pseudosulfitobacter pseudonitzschiae]MBM2294343.1 ABC transporter ATP-binding protein [Pseudosulfitobacter pseudonitzschiae]MBM2299268.1 ABC transporter ATP-binding protein [Pseudosulfitobacter pseudonitzschiae]MBM2304176.1 ABC transporter ATP-binding protein [Pseudosulfitobacter pseudonitzschiae]MBM2313956.1 ABC transporter ATP-binding protein [Pseudosulfitobacter pseudonitzschiae]MBM2318870.1 ABC transporter ATP-binding protein [Pseudosulfitobacter pse